MGGFCEAGKITKKKMRSASNCGNQACGGQVTDKKIMGSVLGYVGTLQQRTVCRDGNLATDNPLPGE